MDLHQFSDWLASTAFSQLIQVSTWAIPAIQTVHIISLALLLACALVLALRIVGRGLSSEPLPQLATRFTRAIWYLLLVLLASGSLLIIAEPGRTITNPAFYTKLVLIALAIAMTLWLATAARREFERLSGLHTLVAGLSLLAWMAIIFAGRLIAYIESY